MSGTIGLVTSIASNLLQAFFAAPRLIGDIVPNITIEESHRDDVYVTKHPVEQGAAITDHAFKENPRLDMRIGFSDAGSILSGPGAAKRYYAQLLQMQEERQPIEVSTGKRLYSNMLITGLTTVTEEGFEYSAVINVRLEQILLVQTQITAVPPASQQSAPQTSAPTVSGGVQQPASIPSTPALVSQVPAPSLLRQLIPIF